MNARSPGKVSPIIIAFLIPLVVIVAAGTFMLVRSHWRMGLEPFDTDGYHRSPDQLQGNQYNLDAQIESQLVWDEGFGRVLAVKPVDGSSRISVFVPDSVATDLHVGQRFHMRVIVKEQGLIQVEGLEKY
jgi:hypothetical protein